MVRLIPSPTKFELSPTLSMNEKVVALREQGQSVLHMGFGESPFPVPERLQEALREHAGRKEYLPTAGLPALREVIGDYYVRHAGIDTSQYDVIVAPGSKLILYALQMAIEGDLLLPDPSWVSYEPQAKLLHTQVSWVPTVLDNAGMQIEPEALRETIRSARAAGQNPRKLILNYPNNPTGLSIPEENLQQIAKVCQDEDILIISDEIYGLVAFDGRYRSIAKYAPEQTAVSTGLSKHLSLGGWRIGVGLIPKSVPGLQGLLQNIASETWSSVAAPIHKAVIEAYKGHEDIEQHIRDCTAIHGLMNGHIAKGLQALGVKAPRPQGAFYNYPDFGPVRARLNAKGIETSEGLAEYLSEKHGLVSLPGTAFGAPADVLTLRLSGCDYDGAAALAAAHAGEALDEAFIQTYAPHIQAAIDAFGQFLND